MSSTEVDLVEVSMVTELVGEPQNKMSSEVGTVTSSVEVAMETVGERVQQTRLVSFTM